MLLLGHLEQNVLRYMRDNIGMSKQERREISKGLMDLRDAADEEEYRDNANVLLATIENLLPEENRERAMIYFNNITETLFEYCVKPSFTDEFIEVNFQTNRYIY